MVRRAARVDYAKMGGGGDTDEDEEQDDADASSYDGQDSDQDSVDRRRRRPSPAKAGRGRGRPRGAARGRGRPAGGRGPRGKISAAKTPASKKMYGRSAWPPRSRYESDEEEEEESMSETEEDSDDEDYGRPPPPKRGRAGGARGRGASRGSRGRPAARSPVKARPTKEKFPPVKVMVIESIKALKDHPKKGSTLGSIKETISLNWPVDMRLYDKKIKRYLVNALATGEVIQPENKKKAQAKGFRGRFTVPGMKAKKTKKRKKAKKESEDESGDENFEYQPPKTARDEEREKHQEELERRREERKMWEEEKAIEKMNRPKKTPPKKNKNKEWEVEAIKGRKFVRGETFYLVKFLGWAKPQWEPEENVDGCVYVEEFLQSEAMKKMEEEERVRQEEEEGAYEVRKIVDFKKDSRGRREFLIRWRGHGPDDDSWEPESNLDCPDLIDKFMAKWEREQAVEGKSLREAPKPVERLEFASSKRVGKRTGGFRISYAGMDI